METYEKQRQQWQSTISTLTDNLKGLTEESGKAIKRLIESEQRFHEIFINAPIGITILRGKGFVVEMANATYLRFVDKDEVGFVGKPLFESVPEAKDTVWPILESVSETGEPYYGFDFEVPLNRFGKKELAYFNFVYYPLKNAEGEVDSIIVVCNDASSQVRARKALENREVQFRNMVMNSPISIAIFRGPDFVIEMANHSMLNGLWQRTLDEVQGRSLLEVFPELEAQKFPELLRRVVETGKAHTEKEAYALVNTPSGMQHYYLDFEYAPYVGADGLVSGVIASAYNVSEKVLARKQIEAAEKRYRDLIDALPVGLYTINQQGYVNLYNRTAAEIWGRQPDIGKDKWCGAVALYDVQGNPVEEGYCAMADVLKGGKTGQTEVYMERPDGTRRFVQVNPHPIADGQGTIEGALNAMVDVTEQKEAENALRASEETFRTLANSMPQLIWTARADGVLTYYSESVYKYSGLTLEQLEGQGWLEMIHPDDRERNLEVWQKSVETGADYHFEHRFLRYDGEYRWQLSRAVPQRDENGNITLWVGTSTDIHDRKLFADELAEKVAERTRELKQKNDDLVRSNSELMQFAYVASHDLQEPLRKIQTFISRILDAEASKLSDRGQDYFGRIEKSSARMQLLIEDLLEFSRTNTANKHFEQADLNKVLGKVREDLSELIVSKRAQISVGKLPKLEVIPFQIAQLFNNLISNAIKFSKPDVPAQINIACEKIMGKEIPNEVAPPMATYYHITIADNGIGFNQEYADRIFMLFQRLHGRDAYEGTGIGLAICKKIVENHNGIITAEGELGRGAIFHIYLPA